jgi:hypothetical protein
VVLPEVLVETRQGAKIFSTLRAQYVILDVHGSTVLSQLKENPQNITFNFAEAFDPCLMQNLLTIFYDFAVF